MKNSSASGNGTPTDPQNYSPAVPITVYRELSAELDSTKAQLEVVNAQNNHLARENQVLRQEIDKLMQSAYRMQQAVNSLTPFTGISGIPTPSANNGGLNSESFYTNPTAGFASKTPDSTAKNPFGFPETAPTNSPPTGRLFTEEQEVRPRRGSKPQRASDLNGMWFAVAIFLIVIAAFGAGYWVVRPMLTGKR